MTACDTGDKSFLSVFERTQLSICLFPVLREFYVGGIFESFKSENNNQEIHLLICNYLNLGALNTCF